MIASALRRVPVRVVARPPRSSSAASPESVGSIAVASETVMIEWGTMTIRKAIE